MILASRLPSYGVTLTALFVIASGITLLQVAANPYVAVVGPGGNGLLAAEPGAGLQFPGHDAWRRCSAAISFWAGRLPARRRRGVC